MADIKAAPRRIPATQPALSRQAQRDPARRRERQLRRPASSEWMAASGFDLARWRKLWVAQNPRNDRSDLARLVMFIENARLVATQSIPGSLAELGVYKGTTAKLLHELLPDRACGCSTPSKASTIATSRASAATLRPPTASTIRRSRRCCATSARASASAPARATFPPPRGRACRRTLRARASRRRSRQADERRARDSTRGSRPALSSSFTYGGEAWAAVAEALDAFLRTSRVHRAHSGPVGTAILRLLKLGTTLRVPRTRAHGGFERPPRAGAAPRAP